MGPRPPFKSPPPKANRAPGNRPKSTSAGSAGGGVSAPLRGESQGGAAIRPSEHVDPSVPHSV
eukprot:7066413-Pyramimonas_sp.AAC.1